MNGKFALDYLVKNVTFADVGHKERSVDREMEGDLAFDIERVMSTGCFRKNESGFMLFDGRVYRAFDNVQLRGVISALFKERNVAKKYVMNSIPNIIKHLESSMIIRQYNPSKEIVSFENTVLMLEDMSMYPHDEKYETNIHLDFDYDPRAKCDRFNLYLKETLPNESVQKVLQEFLGLIFIDRSKLSVEAVLYLYGTGSNGKSVISDMITDMLGKDNVSNFEMYDLTESTTADYKIAQANGKLINFCSDMGDKDFSGGKYKAIASGEEVMGRHPAGRPFKATQLPLLAANVNKMPISRDNTRGHYRRSVVVPFRVDFDESTADKGLRGKLKNELSGIFNWVMEGRKRLIEQGGRFTYSEEIEEAGKKAKIESNSSLLFIQDNEYSLKNNGGILIEKVAQDLYDEYKKWCDETGHRHKSRKTFLADLVSEGCEKGDGRKRYTYMLYNIVPPEFEDEEDEKMDNLPF